MKFNKEELEIIFNCLLGACVTHQQRANKIVGKAVSTNFVDKETLAELLQSAFFLLAVTQLNVRILTDKKSHIRDEEKLRIARENLAIYESLLGDIVRQQDE